MWYQERRDRRLALAAIAWKADVRTVADEKYADVPEMQTWLEDTLADEPVVWLDEVFANKSVRPQGNLEKFRMMCEGFMEQFEQSKIMYRSINPRMIRSAIRDFETRVSIPDVPDRRTFVIINKEEAL